MAKKSGGSCQSFSFAVGLGLALAGGYLYRGQLKSAAARKLSQQLPNPAKERGVQSQKVGDCKKLVKRLDFS